MTGAFTPSKEATPTKAAVAVLFVPGITSYVTVRGTLSVVRAWDEGPGRYELKGPKSERSHRTIEMPAILVTGYASKDVMDKAEQSSITVLFKPIDINEFLSTITQKLRSKDESHQAEARHD